MTYPVAIVICTALVSVFSFLAWVIWLDRD